MAEQEEQEVVDSEELSDPSEASPQKSKSGFIKVGIFLAVIVGLECTAAYLFFPSAADTAAMAQAMLAQESVTNEIIEETEEEEEKEKETIEISLGEFNVTAFQPISNTTLRIDLQLYGTILLEDEGEFIKAFEENEHRLREQVIVTFRSSEINDLTDAGLALIKRKILGTTNRVLGKPLLQEVIFSDFSFIEQ